MDGSVPDRATAADYKFWRSRYRPAGGSGDATEALRPTQKILDAIYARFGEELGSRLNELSWPMSMVWMISAMMRNKDKTGCAAPGNPDQACADLTSRIRAVITSMLEEEGAFREAVLTEARRHCREDDDDALRRQVNAILASRIAAELGLDLNRQISRDDPESLKQALLVALVAGALNVESLEDSDYVPPQPGERRST